MNPGRVVLASLLVTGLSILAACSSEDQSSVATPEGAPVKAAAAGDDATQGAAPQAYAEYAAQCKDFLGGTYIDGRGFGRGTPKGAVARWSGEETSWQFETGERLPAPPGVDTATVAVYAVRNGEAAARFVAVKGAKGWRPTSYIFCEPD